METIKDLSKRHKYKRIPCYRCYNDERSVPSTILDVCSDEMVNGERVLRGTTVLVCARCKKSDEKSCITFGKYKWICQCGANIWWDDPKTDEKCENCGRDRTFWTAVENEDLRYDNKLSKGDHKHIGNREELYEFESIEKLITDFKADVKAYEKGWIR